MDRRTKYDIYADFLKTVMKRGSCGVTRASYEARLPVDRAKKFLRFLASCGFAR
jgi:predicted transcriptional regulator